MTPAEFVRELTYPLRHSAPLVTFATFYVLWLLARSAGLLGIYLLVAVLPAIMRYSLQMLEARARGVDPAPPGIELFTIVGQFWSLFPIVHVAISVGAVQLAEQSFGTAAAMAVAAVLIVVVPLSLIILAVTRSPLESLNPVSMFRVAQRLGSSYWVGPAFVFLMLLAVSATEGLPRWLTAAVDLYLLFALFAVLGGAIRPHDLFAEVDIETPLEPEPEKVISDLERERTSVLNHAYGFASRGNVEGALQHVTGWIRSDEPSPGDAWPWFFDQMLKWDDRFPALKLAQIYLDLLLAAGDARAAAKLMLRCRYIDESFRPSHDSLDAALAAAREAGNPELENWLRRL